MKEKFHASKWSRLFTFSIEYLLGRLTSNTLPVGSEQWRNNMRCSFSQFGEDLLIVAALKAIGRTGVAYYVDVGAFDPVVYSNTPLLSRAGWLGINIDPNPQMINKFKSLRPQDINLEPTIAASPGNYLFHLPKESFPPCRLILAAYSFAEKLSCLLILPLCHGLLSVQNITSQDIPIKSAFP